MKLKKLALYGIALAVLIPSPAIAEKKPLAGAVDARIKTLIWHENEVYQLKGHYGYTISVKFSENERIEIISAGDSSAWQIVKPKRPNILFIKPLSEPAETDMTVITSKRIYTFELSADKAESIASPELTFRLEFIYPNETGPALPADLRGTGWGGAAPGQEDIANLNFSYSYAGEKRLRPERVFDDGIFTFFLFRDFETLPAIFAVNDHGNESLVNFTVQGPYLAVNRTGRQFTLRDGESSTCIFNDAYPQKSGIQRQRAPIAPENVTTAAAAPVPSRKPGAASRIFSNLFASLSGNEFPQREKSFND